MTTVAEASSAAARLLEIATRNADELVDGAKDEADKIIGAARTKAERLETETKTKTDRLESDARTRAAMLDSETEARRKEIFGNLEKEKDQLNTEIEGLRAFEREYRSRLKSYFTQQLETLDGNGASRRRQRPACPERARARSGSARSWARSRATASLRGGSAPEHREREAEFVVTHRQGVDGLGFGHRGGQHLAGDQVAVLGDGRGRLAVRLPGERHPVGDVEAVVLAGLLDQPDHLAGQAGSAQLGVISRSRATVSPCSLTTDQPSEVVRRR